MTTDGEGSQHGGRGRHLAAAWPGAARFGVLVVVLLVGLGGGGLWLSGYGRSDSVSVADGVPSPTPSPTSSSAGLPMVTLSSTPSPTPSSTSSSTPNPGPTPGLRPTRTPNRTAAASPKRVARSLRVMPLGDSITLGNYYAGAYRVGLWKRLVVRDHLKLNFVGSEHNGPSSLPDQDVEAFSGWRTDQFTDNVAGWLRAYRPDVVLLQTGSSDLEEGASAATATSRLNLLLRTMYRTDPKLMVVVSTTTPEEDGGRWYTKRWRDYDAAIPGLVTKYKRAGRSAYLADMHARNFSFGKPDIGDGVHPTATGYVKMNTVWYPVLKRLFYTPEP